MTERHRCDWAGDDPLMRDYHDGEWGVPLRDSRALWECLMLESFQAGLSWRVVLHKREALRAAFADFDPVVVSGYGEEEVLRLMADPGIIRSRAKIEATLGGARIYCDMQANGLQFSDFCWSFTQGKTLPSDGGTRVASTPLSEQISKELKRRGFKFVGPTIAYAWMQAIGMVNDHAAHCFRRDACASA
ncbi:DNA-3-methyladenine glycosylase I [Bordetella sp. FB-8]|uniref:DNA-3-methyladenine glycosylase I n=1 Tax=Bordetella sp. FB-8 TaxID=1159870 RepID=UPI0003779CAB|nr:DNA-3-methyladenine glycosylase I [Bordetella sp. FB-8]